MLLREEIYFHFFTDLIKNSVDPQSEISVTRWPGLLVEIVMDMILIDLVNAGISPNLLCSRKNSKNDKIKSIYKIASIFLFMYSVIT